MVSISVDWQSAFKNVGVDFSKLEAVGVTVAMNSSGLKFAHAGEVVASIPLAPGKISELATKFDPGSKTHLTMKATLASVIGQLEKQLLAPAVSTAGLSPDKGSGSTDKAPPLAAPMPADIKTVPSDKMKTLPVVQLADAEMLFQPVKGTSAGSKYFVVGIGAGIRVAARYKKVADGGKLSVRIEGSAFPKLTAKIHEAGVFGPNFAGSFQGDYASMHIAVDGKKETQRVIGAILGAMAPYIGHATPDLQPLMDAA